MHERMLRSRTSGWSVSISFLNSSGMACTACPPLLPLGAYKHPPSAVMFFSMSNLAVRIKWRFSQLLASTPLLGTELFILSTHFMKADLIFISSLSSLVTAKPDVDIWEGERKKYIYIYNQKKREERHQPSLHSDAIKKAIRAQSEAQIYLCRKLSHFKLGLRTKWLAT